MKKLAYFAMAALLSCACTVEKPNTSNRTPEMLAAFADKVVDWTANAPVYDMNNIAEKPTIWAADWDTTFTCTSGQNITISKAAADSTWTIKTAGTDPNLNFEATIRMRKEKAGTRHEWNYTVTAAYDENNKFSADLSCLEGEPIHYCWAGYLNGMEVNYYLVKSGKVLFNLYYDGVKKDWAKVAYNNGVSSYQYITSLD